VSAAPEILQARASHWRVAPDRDGIVWLYFDMAGRGANVLSKETLGELGGHLAALTEAVPRGLVIASAKENGFIAGADVRELAHLRTQEEILAYVAQAHAVFQGLEDLACPSVAMIHGFCLGGGLELALACRYRVAEDSPRTRLGLPEVRLGIHPGFGGTVRLPRVIGALPALQVMLGGRGIDARSARRIGLVDHAPPRRHLEDAARALVLGAPKLRRRSRWRVLTGHGPGRRVTAAWARRKLRETTRPDHYPAPYALIDLWVRRPRDTTAALREETASVVHLAHGETARNLIRVFLLQERLKSLAPREAPAPERVHVVGAGVMGGDIAAWCALQGLRVTLQDWDNASLGRALQRAYGLFAKRLKGEREVQAAADRLVPDPKGDGLRRAEVVIEAVFEDVAAKHSLYQAIEPRMQAHAVLATNTSSIPLEELAVPLARPERLVGLHFFNPVARMPLVEVVSGPATAAASAELALVLTRRIDRAPLPVRSTPGFLVNRILMPYLLEAVSLVEEGVSAEAVDRSAVDFGFPMGPLALADTVGLDVCLSVARILSARMGFAVPGRLEESVAAGHLGRKAGQGFHRYASPTDRPPAGKVGGETLAEITDRLLLALINEALECLADGVVADADLVDAGVVLGTGFAPFRGGPLQYARTRGVDGLRVRLGELERRYGERFAPKRGWSQRL
jgi:3-hydroxyacyl-CoA dehydrogenase/enoyl-CoA hydratase/3-hydroxybutyryl-CoA epimerase